MEPPPLADDELAYDPDGHSHLYLLNGGPWRLGSANARRNGLLTAKPPHAQRRQCMCLMCLVMFIVLIFWQVVFEYATYLIIDGLFVRSHILLK
jgi:hypothetical protein